MAGASSELARDLNPLFTRPLALELLGSFRRPIGAVEAGSLTEDSVLEVVELSVPEV